MFQSIEKALHELKSGRFILVCDSESREDEADLIMAAEFVEALHVNFMINHGRGLICVPLSNEVARHLDLPLMIREHQGTFETAFTVSVDYKNGTHTGISSKDRALTIRALSDKKSTKSDFARPGHIFPLIAWDQGVLVRPGHTEAAVDLMKLAGLCPVAVLCETLSNEGVPLKGAKLSEFARVHNIPIISITDLIEYRKSHS